MKNLFRGLNCWIVATLISTSASALGQGTEIIFFNFTNTWRYNETSSYDAVNWTAPGFDDTSLPQGRGVLANESANTLVTSRTNTILALGRTTYYFRTRFTFTGNPAGVSLTFSNLVDDGAVYYLNGVEVRRFSMTNAVTPVRDNTLAANHEASAFDVFTLTGPTVTTNLVSGENVLAVEVHQSSTTSSDIVFGLALSATVPETNAPPTLRMPSQPPSYGYQLVNAFGSVTFADPVAVHAPPGETNQLFIVEQDGRISVITNLALPTRTVFLDIASRVLGGAPNDERGLLGMAFHPGYSTNRRFFTFYTTTATTTQGANALHDRLSEWRTLPGNPAAADPSSELVLFQQFDEAGNHNGGDVHFGPDGYLYVSLGDEGGGNDQYQNSQRIDRDFFAGLLRLDVDDRPGSLLPNPHPANTNNPGRIINYRIPADNPWVGATSFNGSAVVPANVRTEFYAVGLRNPWRFSFDSATGDLYLADVGQNIYEEVNIIRRGGNYGWSYREALHAGPRGNPPAGVVFDHPIVEYGHGSGTNQGLSVSGGVVYRGNRIPALNGAYIFADYVSGNVWSLRADGTNVVAFPQLLADAGIAGFGIDPRNGDVLTCDQSDDTIKRLVIDTNAVVGTLPPTLADTGAFTNLLALTNRTQALTPNTGVVPYDINVPFWSDGANKERWFFMATNGAKIGFAPEGNWSLPAGMAWVKHFDLEMTNGEPSSARRLETRILVRNNDGMYGVTYRWGNSLTNAILVPDEGMDESFVIHEPGGLLRTQVWHYPGRAECLTCHTPAGGWALGFNTVQMNRPVAGTNQIAALSAAGYFNNAVSNIHALRALSPAHDETASREWRVRSYLAANCAQCHQSGGSGLGTWTANITNYTGDAGLIHGALVNNGGNTNARVIVPGSLTNSMLLSRISYRGPGQMPPLASSVVDTQAVALLSAWITNDLAAGWTNAIETFLISAHLTNGAAAIQFVQPANRAHRVESTTHLGVTPWQFVNVPENQPTYPAVSNGITVTDPQTNSAQKFYRVRQSTP